VLLKTSSTNPKGWLNRITLNLSILPLYDLLTEVFNSVNIDIINNCWWYYDFQSASEQLVEFFEREHADHKELHCYFGICTI